MAEPGRPQRKLSRVGESLYRVLGLQKGSSPEEIKKAYRYGGARAGGGGGPSRGRGAVRSEAAGGGGAGGQAGVRGPSSAHPARCAPQEAGAQVPPGQEPR